MMRVESRSVMQDEEETIEEALKSLLMKGLISVSYNENLEAMFTPTPLGIAVAETYK
jgi:DNA-binding PadR family transcriptional regulator